MGMSVEALIAMARDQPNRDLIASLKVDSAFLQLQHHNFRMARSKMRQAKVIAFFETVMTPTIVNVSLQNTNQRITEKCHSFPENGNRLDHQYY